jgi:hypothetical protein
MKDEYMIYFFNFLTFIPKLKPRERPFLLEHNHLGAVAM